MKYAASITIISLLLLSFNIPLFETVRTVYLKETVEVATPNDALYTLPQGNPLPGYTINSKFGMRKHPVWGVMKMHTGVDQACPVGTNLYAMGNGKITRIEYKKGGYGTNIDVTHGLGADGKSIVSVRYAHLSEILVKVGQFVKQGELIARTGNTGTSTGSHLHFEYRLNGHPKNPIKHVDFTDENGGLLKDTIINVSMFEREYFKLYQLSKDDTLAASNGLWRNNCD